MKMYGMEVIKAFCALSSIDDELLLVPATDSAGFSLAPAVGFGDAGVPSTCAGGACVGAFAAGSTATGRSVRSGTSVARDDDDTREDVGEPVLATGDGLGVAGTKNPGVFVELGMGCPVGVSVELGMGCTIGVSVELETACPVGASVGLGTGCPMGGA